jgi:hypothetical protein
MGSKVQLGYFDFDAIDLRFCVHSEEARDAAGSREGCKIVVRPGVLERFGFQGSFHDFFTLRASSGSVGRKQFRVFCASGRQKLSGSCSEISRLEERPRSEAPKRWNRFGFSECPVELERRLRERTGSSASVSALRVRDRLAVVGRLTGGRWAPLEKT